MAIDTEDFTLVNRKGWLKVAQLVECLPSMRRALGFIPSTTQNGAIVVQTYIQYLGGRGRAQVQGHPQLSGELEASLGDRGACLNQSFNW